MRIYKGWIKGMCTLLIFPLLSGCWDRIEIEDRAIVLGMSIDVAGSDEGKKEEEIAHKHDDLPIPDRDMIKVAIQIALPGRIPLGPGDGGGGGGGSTKETVWVVGLAGHTMADAVANIQQEISSKLFFGHLRIVVVSEAVAKKGIEDINLFLRRHAEVRTTSWMVVSKGKAETLLKAAPKLERVPTLYLLSTLEEGVKMGKLPLDFLAAFWARSSKKGQEGFLLYVEKEKGENINIAGIALFNHERLVEVINPFESVAFLGIRGENPAGHPVIIGVPGTNGTVTVHTIKRNSKIKSKIIDGTPTFTVVSEIEFQLDEKSTKEIVINQEMLKKLEDLLSQRLNNNFRELIKHTQAHRSDIIGFGEILRAKESKYWNQQIKTKEKWQEVYTDAKVDVHVKAIIRRVGMTAW